MPSGTKGAGGATALPLLLKSRIGRGEWGSCSGCRAAKRPGRALSPAAPVSRSLSSLRRRRAVVGGAGSQKWSVYLCARLGGSQMSAQSWGNLGKERRLAEHKLARTPRKDCPPINIPDLSPLTSDTLPQAINIFPRAKWKAKARGGLPRNPFPARVQSHPPSPQMRAAQAPSPWPGAG